MLSHSKVGFKMDKIATLKTFVPQCNESCNNVGGGSSSGKGVGESRLLTLFPNDTWCGVSLYLHCVLSWNLVSGGRGEGLNK